MLNPLISKTYTHHKMIFDANFLIQLGIPSSEVFCTYHALLHTVGIGHFSLFKGPSALNLPGMSQSYAFSYDLP